MGEELGGVEGSWMMNLRWVALKHPKQCSFERGCEMRTGKAMNCSESPKEVSAERGFACRKVRRGFSVFLSRMSPFLSGRASASPVCLESHVYWA